MVLTATHSNVVVSSNLGKDQLTLPENGGATETDLFIESSSIPQQQQQSTSCCPTTQTTPQRIGSNPHHSSSTRTICVVILFLVTILSFLYSLIFFQIVDSTNMRINQDNEDAGSIGSSDESFQERSFLSGDNLDGPINLSSEEDEEFNLRHNTNKKKESSQHSDDVWEQGQQHPDLNYMLNPTNKHNEQDMDEDVWESVMDTKQIDIIAWKEDHKNDAFIFDGDEQIPYAPTNEQEEEQEPEDPFASIPEAEVAKFLNTTVGIDHFPGPLEWYDTVKTISTRAKDCTTSLKRLKPGSLFREIKKADCGAGYVLPDPKKNIKPWKVGLYGNWKQEILWLSGCGLGRSCPLSPQCEFSIVKTNEELDSSNVVIVPSYDHRLVNNHIRTKDNYRVMYWREAMWASMPSERSQLKDFDFEMGVHTFSGARNPNFMLAPSDLLRGMFLNVKKEFFAASLISDCKTLSHRQTYIDHLISYLGATRVHQYGHCGNMNLPPRPLAHAMRILAKYKL
jgi:hypothetical protein